MEIVSNVGSGYLTRGGKCTEEQAGGTKTKFIPLTALSETRLGTMVRLAIRRHPTKYIHGMSLSKPRRHGNRHVAGGQAVDW